MIAGLKIALQILTALPTVIKAFTALMAFANEMQEKKRVNDLEKVKKDLENAESEDDFRDAARDLAKSRN